MKWLRINKFKKFFNQPDWWWIGVVILSIPACLPLFYQGFFPTQDYIFVARIFAMFNSLVDGQFPVRWVSDFRYGEPLFNFYAPLPYYLGALIHVWGLSFIDTSKILIGASLTLSGLAMFALAKKLFGNLGGLISSAFYLYAPYHSVDIYVRGALSEAWSMVFLPLIFLFSYQLITSFKTRFVVLLTVSLTGLFYTHNIMSMLILPFFLVWSIFLLGKNFTKKTLLWYGMSLALSLCLAASFLLPALFEKDFIQSTALSNGYFDFRVHFVEIKQFFVPFWGYGNSVWGAADGLSFQVGLVHWLGLALVIAVLIFEWFKFKRFNSLIVLLVGLFAFSLFIQHNRSTFIWTHVPLLGFAQFPWRFLELSIFLVSLLIGYLSLYFKKQWTTLGFVLIILVISVNLSYFQPQGYYPNATDQTFTSPQVLSQEDRLPKDYVPTDVRAFDPRIRYQPEALTGQIQTVNFKKGSNWAFLDLQVLKDSDLQVPISYFPGWQVRTQNQLISFEPPLDIGLIHFALPQGRYQLYFKFTDTPIRLISNIISVISLVVFLSLSLGKLLWKRR